MNSATKDMYNLMANLGRAEKAYFKKFGFAYKRKGVKAEQLLFDMAVKSLGSKPPNADFEEQLKQKWKRKAKRSFQQVQKRMFEHLTEALHRYDRAQRKESELIEWHGQALALMRRGAYVAALHKVDKIIEEVKARGWFKWQLAAIETKLRIAIHFDDREEIMALEEEEDYLLGEQLALNKLRKWLEQTFEIHRKHGHLRADENEDLKTLVKLYASHDISPASPKRKFNYYAWGKVLAYVTQNTNDLLFCLQKMVDIANHHPTLFEHREKAHIATLADLIYHGIEADQLTYYHQYFPLLTDADKWQQPAADQYRKQQVLRIEALYGYHQKKFDTLLEQTDLFLDELPSLNPSYAAGLLEDFIVASFAMGKYKALADWVRRTEVYHKKHDLTRATRERRMRTLLLLTYLLDGDFPILATRLNALKQAFDFKNTPEEIMLNLCHCTLGENGLSPKEAAKEALSALQAIDYQVGFGHIDYTLVCRVLIEGKSYHRLAREKLEESNSPR